MSVLTRAPVRPLPESAPMAHFVRSSSRLSRSSQQVTLRVVYSSSTELVSTPPVAPPLGVHLICCLVDDEVSVDV